jgi:hypothetical protein
VVNVVGPSVSPLPGAPRRMLPWKVFDEAVLHGTDWLDGGLAGDVAA